MRECHDIYWMQGDITTRHDGGLLVEGSLKEEPLISRRGRTSQWDWRGNVCQEKNTHLHAISCSKTRWSSLMYNQVLHEALVTSLRENKVQFVIQETWHPFQRGQVDIRADPTRCEWTWQRRRGHPSIATPYARARRCCSKAPKSTLASAPI